MRKKRLMWVGLLLFLSAGLLIPTPSGFLKKALGQEQPKRPRFYSLQVVCKNNVQNAEDSLGAPDGRYAEILPGGEFIVFMENKLYPFPIFVPPEGGSGLADSGSIIGKGETDFALEGWFPVQDNQGKQNYVWEPLGLSMSGFCVCLEGSAGLEMIRIVNSGKKSLFVDAVVGFVREMQ